MPRDLAELKQHVAALQSRIKDISVPPRRINEIAHGTRAVTADTALRLARSLGTSVTGWPGCGGLPGAPTQIAGSLSPFEHPAPFW